MRKFLQFLGFVSEETCLMEIQERFWNYFEKAYRIIRVLVFSSEVLMLISIAVRSGGPFKTERRTGYVLLYLFLIVLTLCFTLFHRVMRKKGLAGQRLCMGAGAWYLAFNAFWCCGITLLDQLGGNGLTVYTYIMLTIAMVAILKPWQSILIFGASFFTLNTLLPLFPDPNGMDQTFNNMLNSLFVSVSSAVIAVSLYRSRLKSYKDQAIIQEQYREIREINEKLNQEVVIDCLTGLYNRKYLSHILAEKYNQEIRNGQSFSCIMIDIDFFKQYNDCYGHQKGDDCLRSIALLMQECFDVEQQRVIRYGGEEFIVCLFETEQEEAQSCAEEYQKQLKHLALPHQNGIGGIVTVSMGIASKRKLEQVDLRYLIHCADDALYDAKRYGRNRIERYCKRRQP